MHDRRKPRVLVVGPLPPPLNGMSVVTRTLLESPVLRERADLGHFDTSDHRGVGNQGVLDLLNIWHAVRHGVHFSFTLLRKRWDIAYVPIAQNVLGFLRDLLFLIPARLFRRQVVVHLHGGYFDTFYRNSPWWMKPLIRFGLGGVSAGVVLAPGLKRCLLPVMSERRIRVVPNGIQDPLPTLHPDKGGGGFRVLYLGNLFKSKGIGTVLESVPAVVKAVPQSSFVLAGDWLNPQEQADAMALVKGGGHADRVWFCGGVQGTEKERLLQEADLLVMPTFYPFEGQPLVLLEAMAASLPIVTTRLPGIEEILPGPDNTLYVDPRDPAALAAAIIALAQDPLRRQNMGKANRARFLAHYTAEAFADRMAAVFDDVLFEKGKFYTSAS